MKVFTMRIDEQLYEQLSYKAAIEGSNTTKKIRELVANYVNDELSPLDRTKVSSAVKQAIDDYAQKEFISQVSEMVAQKLGLSYQDKNISKVSEVSEVKELDIEAVSEGLEELSKNYDKTELSEIPKESNKTDKLEPIEKIQKRENNLAKFKRGDVRDNKKTHSDLHVASSEGLTKETIRKYRKGDRSPKSEFIERWGLSWDGKGWVKI